MFLLKFIFFIFIIGLFAVLFFALRIYLTVRRMKNDIRSRMSQEESPQGPSTTTTTGETITDTRSPSARRKIIADDEGEYIDFEETEN